MGTHRPYGLLLGWLPANHMHYFFVRGRRRLRETGGARGGGTNPVRGWHHWQACVVPVDTWSKNEGRRRWRYSGPVGSSMVVKDRPVIRRMPCRGFVGGGGVAQNMACYVWQLHRRSQACLWYVWKGQSSHSLVLPILKGLLYIGLQRAARWNCLP